MNYVKFFRILIDNRMSWKKTYKLSVNKLIIFFIIIYKASSILDKDGLKIQNCCPHIDYCCEVWGNIYIENGKCYRNNVVSEHYTSIFQSWISLNINRIYLHSKPLDVCRRQI